MSIAQNLYVKFIIFSVSSALFLTMGFLFANAQEEVAELDAPATIAAEDAAAEELVEQDENITPQDLDVGDPNILPGNPLYAFKNFGRGFQSFFTFDPAAKAELRLKFANEKVIEAKKLEEGGASDDRVRAAIESYEQEAGRVKIRIENLKDSGKTKEEIELIVKRTADNQIKHHKALGRVMKNRDGIAPEIEALKTAAMRRFSEGMANVVEPEVLRQKFEEAIRDQRGSSFRQFRNITVLEEVKDFVPLAARGAIQNAIENSSKAFEEEFSNTSEEQRRIFSKYIEKMGGNEVRHLEAFDDLNAFTDMQKEMFAEMEKAREKARKRVEKRMAGIHEEDAVRKQIFIAHLEEGKLEDARIVKELETNLDPNTITTILDIKHKMEQNMREKFENAESTGDLDDFFGEMENFRDVQMMQTLTEMEAIIPADKRDFWQEMKKKAMTEMQNEIDRSRQLGRAEDKIRMMAGFNPEDMAVLDDFEGEFGPQFTFFEDMRREQAEKIQSRFEHFREFAGENPDDTAFFEEAEKFRFRIEQDEHTKNRIEQYAPTITTNFREFEEGKKDTKISPIHLDAVIEEAEELVQKLSARLAQADDKNPGKSAARQLYNNASTALADIAILRNQNKLGEAFGKATSAKNLAASGLRKLEQEAFKEERREYFDERDKFREQFRDLPEDERPDPSQLPRFESRVSPDFAPSVDMALPISPEEREEQTREEHKERATSAPTQIEGGTQLLREFERLKVLQPTPVSQNPPTETSGSPTRTFDSGSPDSETQAFDSQLKL